MATDKHCGCGRKIMVRRRRGNRFVAPRDKDHVFCRRCWRSELDRARSRPTRSEPMACNADLQIAAGEGPF